MPRRGEAKESKGSSRHGNKHGKGAQNLGRAIMRQQFSAAPVTAELETERGKHRLRSVTQTDDLEELMAEATLAGKDFSARRGEVVILSNTARSTRPAEVAPPPGTARDLPVPRRPAWKPGQPAEELETAERAAFLDWRRELADLEDNQRYILTPFEKNLEVWRQLWRVMERSQLLVQIVDARNPLLFRCVDLEKYASELRPPRPCMLIVNKADLLSEAQRVAWAKYFSANKIEFVFWSAAKAQHELEEEARLDRLEEAAGASRAHTASFVGEGEGAEHGSGGVEGDADHSGDGGGDDDADDGGDGLGDDGADGDGQSTRCAIASATDAADAADSCVRVLSREELMAMLLKRCPPGPPAADGTTLRTIGLVGYPNVGKSSTVNVMVSAKKTSVSATPGKTKHFQTLRVPDEPGILLCDCPGLVFPSVAGSKAQMICDGILPIDQMRDYITPIRLLCSRLTADAFLQAYGLRLRTAEERADDPEAPEPARELLMAHAISRGFMTATKGGPDESRSARIILKDLVNAKLLCCTPPPNENGADAAALNDGSSQSRNEDGRDAAVRRKQPSAPTAERYLHKMKQDFDAQDGTGACFSGRKGTAALGSLRGVQWRGAQNALPDRMVASGPRPAVAISHAAGE